MTVVVSERSLSASPAEVYALVSDPVAVGRLTAGDATVVSDERTGDRMRRVTFETCLEGGGRIREVTCVTEAHQDRSVVSHTTIRPVKGGPMMFLGKADIARTVTLEPHAAGTLVKVATDLRPKPAPVGALLGILCRRRWQRQAREHMDVLEKELGSAYRSG